MSNSGWFGNTLALFRRNSGDSVPNSPVLSDSDQELDSFSLAYTKPFGSARTHAITKDIINDMFTNCFGTKTGTPSKYYKTVCIVINEIKNTNGEFLCSIVDKLEFEDGNCFETYIQIANGMFDDTINWGRIGALLAVTERILKNCKQNHSECNKNIFKEDIINYFDKKFGKWIDENNGWDAFVVQFMNEDIALDFVKKGLWFISGTAAIAALGFFSLKR